MLGSTNIKKTVCGLSKNILLGSLSLRGFFHKKFHTVAIGKDFHSMGSQGFYYKRL
jgi:hypothetical protein